MNRAEPTVAATDDRALTAHASVRLRVFLCVPVDLSFSTAANHRGGLAGSYNREDMCKDSPDEKKPSLCLVGTCQVRSDCGCVSTCCLLRGVVQAQKVKSRQVEPPTPQKEGSTSWQDDV